MNNSTIVKSKGSSGLYIKDALGEITMSVEFSNLPPGKEEWAKKQLTDMYNEILKRLGFD